MICIAENEAYMDTLIRDGISNHYATYLVVLPLVQSCVEVSSVREDFMEGGLRHVAVELVVPGHQR